MAMAFLYKPSFINCTFFHKNLFSSFLSCPFCSLALGRRLFESALHPSTMPHANCYIDKKKEARRSRRWPMVSVYAGIRVFGPVARVLVAVYATYATDHKNPPLRGSTERFVLISVAKR